MMPSVRVSLPTALAMLLLCNVVEAQSPNKIKATKLFDSTPVTESAPCVGASGCSPVQDRLVFDETLLVLSCPVSPTAILSSTADGRGGVIADNWLEVNGSNVCSGGVNAYGIENCFGPESMNVITSLDGYQPILPLDVSAYMPKHKAEPVMFRLVDYGGIYASSDVWLVSNCAVRRKAAICHKPRTPAEKILVVGTSAVAGHLGHGDTLDLTACRR